MRLTATLIRDGKSDTGMLTPIISWLFNDLYDDIILEMQSEDFKNVAYEIKVGDILEKIKYVGKEINPDIIFVHRDSEKQGYDARLAEIEDKIKNSNFYDKIVRVIPIRMTEAWLLTDARAICIASGIKDKKKFKQVQDKLPKIGKIEEVSHPKMAIQDIIRELKKDKSSRNRGLPPMALIADNTENFAALRNLSAFKKFEEEVKTFIDKHRQKPVPHATTRHSNRS